MTFNKCSIEGCNYKTVARGWCKIHYARWRRYGDPLTFRGNGGKNNGMYKDGRVNHPEWHRYQSMLIRCTYPSSNSYVNYGGRGIYVCDEWKNDFWAFVEDMGIPPDGYVLDRIDNEGPYSAKNCRWVDRTTSTNNRRVRKDSRERDK